MRTQSLALFVALSLAACSKAATDSAAPVKPDVASAPGAAATAASTTAAIAPGAKAEIGKPAPDFTLTDIDGKQVSLSSFKGKTVVLEWFNPGCPFVKRNHTEGPLKDMAKNETAKGTVWLSINSGAPGKQGAGKDESVKGREKYGMTNPILLDENGAVGRAYGAKSTPTMFVIDKTGALVYRGAIDNAPDGDPRGSDKVENYVTNALSDLAAGKPVQKPETESYGCGVKYGSS
jgi:peroxiredoxin